MAWPSPPGGDAGVYTDWRKRPLDAVSGHLCTLLRLLRGSFERPWRRRSVHRLAKTDSRRRFGALVYTVAPLRTAVATQECTQIGGNGLSGPFWGICVHCCAARIVRADGGDAGVYTDWRKRPLDAVLGHLCTLLRRDSPRRQPTRTSEEPKMFPDWRSRRGRRAALYARDRQLLSSSTSSRMSSMAASGLVCRSE